MKFDFDEINDRSGTYSLKWDIKDGELPMWVADMDFKTAPCITSAIEQRAKHGIFGYTIIPDEWYDAYISWWKSRHEIQLHKDWLMFCTGVIPAISSIVRKITTPAEKVVVQTPVYNIFCNCIENNGRQILENKLVYENGNYCMDYDDLEQKLADPQTTLLILCNPQNPAGRIWSREELEKVGELCARYGVTVISDEIHCDITEPGKRYVPFASINDECRDNSITLISPTKAFNIAGLQTAAISVPSPRLRHKVWRAINTDECAEPNVFAMTAAIAALTDGGEWLDSLNEYLSESKKTVYRFLEENVPQVKALHSDATYLMWLDVSAVTDNSKELASFIRKETGLYLSAGAAYRGNGNLFLRLNIACPHSVLNDGLERLKKGINGYIANK